MAKVKRILEIARNYPFSMACIVVVWALSLTPFFPETPFDKIAFIDKWTHFVMYGGTTLVIWCEYRYRHRHPHYRQLALWGWLAPVLMGGLLELLQAYATTTRNGDWLDFVANALGATLGAAAGRGFYLLHDFAHTKKTEDE